MTTESFITMISPKSGSILKIELRCNYSKPSAAARTVRCRATIRECEPGEMDRLSEPTHSRRTGKCVSLVVEALNEIPGRDSGEDERSSHHRRGGSTDFRAW